MRTLDDVRVLHLADVLFEESWRPVNAWLVSGGDGLVLVDTGIVETTPELDAEWPTRLHPWPALGEVSAVVNTHLHFDHCGGNRSFPGVPIFVQRAEYEAVAEPGYVVEWVHAPDLRYELVDGDAELLPGISALFTPGHSPGHQVVVVETDQGAVILAGDATYDLADFEPASEPASEAGTGRQADDIRSRRPCGRWLTGGRSDPCALPASGLHLARGRALGAGRRLNS